MSSRYQCKISGKWILCGEHAVVRGKPALVFPFKNKQLSLNFVPCEKDLSADFSGVAGDDLHLLFWSVIKQAFKLLNKNMNTVHGYFRLENQIPIGTGLGASAALSVAISKWLISQNLLSENECFSFSQELENLFHKKSSGLDIAGCMSANGVFFTQGKSTLLEPLWHPKFYLSFSGAVGITSHCVQKVEDLFEADYELAEKLDEQMGQTTLIAYEALMQKESPAAIKLLAEAIELAGDCFSQWQLCNIETQNQINLLKNSGAIAAKPTGSGSGGFILSLWQEDPPSKLKEKLISV